MSREKPYLYVDAHGRYHVFVPGRATNSAGDDWAAGPTPGRSVPLVRLLRRPAARLRRRRSTPRWRAARTCCSPPGVYDVDRTIEVKRADTVVLGLGFATLTPPNGTCR